MIVQFPIHLFFNFQAADQSSWPDSDKYKYRIIRTYYEQEPNYVLDI